MKFGKNEIRNLVKENFGKNIFDENFDHLTNWILYSNVYQKWFFVEQIFENVVENVVVLKNDFFVEKIFENLLWKVYQIIFLKKTKIVTWSKFENFDH